MVKSVDRRIVLPGEEVSVAEEFELVGDGYMDRYVARSAVLGVAEYDVRSHVAMVRPLRQRPTIRQGDVVHCVVEGKGARHVAARCFAVEEQGALRYLPYTFTAIMLVPQHIGDVNDVGVGDYVRARIASRYGPPYTATIKAPHLGVTYSLCPRCRTPMRRAGQVLRCPSCGLEVRRKVALI